MIFGLVLKLEISYIELKYVEGFLFLVEDFFFADYIFVW
jgi:hypothetical protein